MENQLFPKSFLNVSQTHRNFFRKFRFSEFSRNEVWNQPNYPLIYRVTNLAPSSSTALNEISCGLVLNTRLVTCLLFYIFSHWIHRNKTITFVKNLITQQSIQFPLDIIFGSSLLICLINNHLESPLQENLEFRYPNPNDRFL